MDILNHHSDAPWTNKVYESQDLICYKDKYPVTEGHLLIVPKKKDPTTIGEAFKLAYVEGQTMVREGMCDSFNVGMNSGVEAGQTIGWPHIHVIPRRKGDVEDPTGGIRNIIPGKGKYETTE